jgi:RNA recognition motif-containing protein
VTWKGLRDAFGAACPGVERADVVLDAAGRSRGFGTVKFASAEEAGAAVEAMNHAGLSGRTIMVRIDRYA